MVRDADLEGSTPSAERLEVNGATLSVIILQIGRMIPHAKESFRYQNNPFTRIVNEHTEGHVYIVA